jgi:hypothetical protein
MVRVLSDQNMRQQPKAAETFVDRAMRRRFLQDA